MYKFFKFVNTLRTNTRKHMKKERQEDAYTHLSAQIVCACVCVYVCVCMCVCVCVCVCIYT